MKICSDSTAYKAAYLAKAFPDVWQRKIIVNYYKILMNKEALKDYRVPLWLQLQKHKERSKRTLQGGNTNAWAHTVFASI